MEYKFLILDVDGTLVKSSKDARPSEKVVKAIHEASKLVKVGLCTGRSYPDVKNLINTLRIDDSYHVIESGTKVINPKGEIEYTKSLLDREIKEIIRIAGNLPSGYGFCVDGTWKNKLEEVDKDKTVTVLTLHSNNKNQTQLILNELEEVKDKFNIHVGSKWDNPDGAYIAITNNEASKEFGLKYIQKKLGIKKEETIGVGDFPNDLPLFKVSGLKIAMGNGDIKLKEQADVIAPSLEEDGVAWVVQKYVLHSL